MNIKERILMLGLIIAVGLTITFTITADEPHGNGVIVAGNFWASYRPPHNTTSWPGRNAYVDDFKARGDAEANGNWIFWQSRYISSGRFGNTVAAWPFGRNIAGPWGEPLAATVYDPSLEFADANAKAFEQIPLEPKDLQYSYLKYGKNIPGAGDPARDFVRPGGKTEGGAWFKDARKGVVYYEAGWPTNVGIDVKMRVISMTTTWGNLDDNQVVEVEFYNTGEADIDNDGVVDLSNHRIESLALQYHGEPWYMSMRPAGTRWYNVVNGYRPGFHDATPDENGAPWSIGGYGFGADDRDNEDDPGVSSRQGDNTGWYMDIVYGWSFLGAKKIENGLVVGEKMLSFQNSAGEEVVHPVGEGSRRGWFKCNTTTESQQGGAGTSARGTHLNATAQFFVAGSKNRSRTDVDFNFNSAMFVSGNEEDLSSFVVKDDPATWGYPDGAFETVPPVTSLGGIQLAGPNPIPTFGGAQNRPFQSDLLHEGWVSENPFNDHPTGGFGPFALDVGETIRVYFVRGMGHRLNNLRASIKAARAMYDGIQPDGSFVDPGAPGVPDIKVTGSTNVKPLIMFNAAADADGYKVYRSKAWPPYLSTDDGLMFENAYWKTMTPGAENRPTPDPLNPMLTDFSRVREKPGEHWGPYVLLKAISNADLVNFANPRVADAGEFPYAYEDNEDAFTLPGQTFYYYVSAYKNSTPPAPYDQLEGGSVSWIESGKVNVNGRTGLWENTWPFTPRDSFFPDVTDVDALKDLGASFVLVSPPVTVADLELGRANIVVRPNPYKRLAFHDVGSEHKILFANLPSRATITILDLSGQIIDRIDFESPTDENGTFFWEMFSKNGVEVASGVYIWVVEHERGVEKGLLSILR